MSENNTGNTDTKKFATNAKSVSGGSFTVA